MIEGIYARNSTKKTVQIPFLLSEAVKNGRAILFLGAGASKECRNSRGDSPPNAEQLRDIISTKYLGKLMPNRSLMSVAEMAIENGAGLNLVFETVNTAFTEFNTSDGRWCKNAAPGLERGGGGAIWGHSLVCWTPDALQVQ